MKHRGKAKNAADDPLYRFAWPIDQDGYVIERIEGMPGGSLLSAVSTEYMRGRGGPWKYYRPMEDCPGLWRQFAETCTSPKTALVFANEFGLPSLGAQPGQTLQGPSEFRQQTLLQNVLNWAAVIREIVRLLDTERREDALMLFNERSHAETSMWIWRGELRPFPKTLLSAMHIQTGEALTKNHIFKRCENHSCSTWFKVGTGAHTKRKLYCTDRCRVAANRQSKEEGR